MSKHSQRAQQVASRFFSPSSREGGKDYVSLANQIESLLAITETEVACEKKVPDFREDACRIASNVLHAAEISYGADQLETVTFHILKALEWAAVQVTCVAQHAGQKDE